MKNRPLRTDLNLDDWFKIVYSDEIKSLIPKTKKMNDFGWGWDWELPPKIPEECEHEWEQASGWISGKITWECKKCKEVKDKK